MILRPHQEQDSKDGLDILLQYNLFYYMAEVRTGKTATALTIADSFENVLFLTKKKAISSILSDFQKLGYKYNLEVTNYESLHKVDSSVSWDLIILDEAHCFGSFPKRSKRLVQIRAIKCDYHIFLSGTPTAESWSQIFHQLDASRFSPFSGYANFYKWAHDYVNKKIKYLSLGMTANDYSEGKLEKIKADISHVVITRSQEEVGFKSVIKDQILTVAMEPRTYAIADRLLRDEVVFGKSGVILADTGAKMQQKLMQIYSGTCKLEDDKTIIFDRTKADYIKEYFKGKRIGIFYLFKAEWEMIKDVFGDTVTQDTENQELNIAGQITSIREGVSLKHLDALVFFNIHHSHISYQQARDRMNGLEVLENQVYFIFAEGGIESKIYRVVTQDKSKYNINAFRKDYGKHR